MKYCGNLARALLSPQYLIMILSCKARTYLTAAGSGPARAVDFQSARFTLAFEALYRARCTRKCPCMPGGPRRRNPKCHAQGSVVLADRKWPVLGLEAFWNTVAEGVDLPSQPSLQRWDIDHLFSPDPNGSSTVYTRFGSYLSCLDSFDAACFKLSPAEAVSLDPHARLLLENTQVSQRQSQ